MIPDFLRRELHTLLPVAARIGIGPHSDFVTLGLDDLDIVTLAMAVEEELTIELSDVQIQSWSTLGCILAEIERRGRVVA